MAVGADFPLVQKRHRIPAGELLKTILMTGSMYVHRFKILVTINFFLQL
jgi:hypothetical protein